MYLITENDVVLSEHIKIFDAERALCRAINNGSDAYLEESDNHYYMLTKHVGKEDVEHLSSMRFSTIQDALRRRVYTSVEGCLISRYRLDEDGTSKFISEAPVELYL